MGQQVESGKVSHSFAKLAVSIFPPVFSLLNRLLCSREQLLGSHEGKAQ